MRPMLVVETAGEMLDGEVEIDGAYIRGHVHPQNHVDDRKDRRLKENQSDRRRVMVALRERGARALSFVRKSEAEGVDIARARMVKNAKLSPMKPPIGAR